MSLSAPPFFEFGVECLQVRFLCGDYLSVFPFLVQIFFRAFVVIKILHPLGELVAIVGGRRAVEPIPRATTNGLDHECLGRGGGRRGGFSPPKFGVEMFFERPQNFGRTQGPRALPVRVRERWDAQAVSDPPVGGRKGRFGPASFVRPLHGGPKHNGVEKKSTAGSIS